MLIFPGSFSFWSKPAIKNYSKIVTFTLRHQANEFCSNIENFKSKNKSHLCFDLLTALDTLFNIFYVLQTTVGISKKQNEIKEILDGILKDLHRIELEYLGTRISLRDWYENRPCGFEKCKFVEETLVVSKGFVRLDKVLKQDCEVFASLNYMRADLIYSYNSSNFTITTPDKTTLDCLFIPSENSNIAVIICGPNASLYEFGSFQTDFIKLYLEMGINVILWNYRGYGRSKGRPTIDKLKKDGENIVNYIRTQKLHIKVLGVHGESIGGCIAVHLAKECVLDFLVADRTFASIKAVALFRYGRIAYWMSWLARIEDFEYTGEYLASNCPKVIICDPADMVINDLASLKAGVAIRLLSHDVVNMVELAYLNPYLQSGFNHIISYAASTSCVTSLSRLQSYIEYLKSGSEDLIVHQYSALSLDTEEIPNDHLASSIDKMLNSLSNLEAGGSTLLDITKSTQGNLSLIIWLMVLDIWGSCCKVGDEQLSNHLKSVEAIRSCLQDIQGIQDEFEKSKNRVVQEVMKDVNTVFNVLIEILGYMEERCGLSSNLEISIDRMINEFQGAGQLIPVSCGHCGSLSQVERYQLTRFLMSSLK